MAQYKRQKRIRPILIIKPIPIQAQKFVKYYVGFDEEKKQYVFEFPTSELVKEFTDKVGGDWIGKDTCVLSAEVREAPKEKDVFVELQEYLNNLYQKKQPYLELLGVSGSELSFITALWEREFWRDKYFKEKQKNGKTRS